MLNVCCCKDAFTLPLPSSLSISFSSPLSVSLSLLLTLSLSSFSLPCESLVIGACRRYLVNDSLSPAAFLAGQFCKQAHYMAKKPSQFGKCFKKKLLLHECASGSNASIIRRFSTNRTSGEDIPNFVPTLPTLLTLIPDDIILKLGMMAGFENCDRGSKELCSGVFLQNSAHASSPLFLLSSSSSPPLFPPSLSSSWP